MRKYLIGLVLLATAQLWAEEISLSKLDLTLVKQGWGKAQAGKAVTVDIKAVEPVRQPVSLAAMKADGRFKEFGLVRQSRLSVVPVGEEHWKLLTKMASGK